MNGATAPPAKVLAVLLADGWHQVVPGSFSVGTLGFAAEAGLGMPGFRFEEADPASPYRPAVLAGPLGSILAVRQVDSAARQRGELTRPAPSRWARSTPEAVA
jgi:hypothetical protein